MNEPLNPYQAPQASLTPESPEGYWRDGKVLVMRPGSALPPRCVKCNGPAEQPAATRTVYWHPPALYLLIIFPGLLIYAIVALIVRKKASVAPGLCAEHLRRRRMALAGGWAGSILGIALAIYWAANDSCGLSPLGVLLLFGSMVAGIILARIVYPERIDKDFVRLKGCDTSFLAALPEFNG